LQAKLFGKIKTRIKHLIIISMYGNNYPICSNNYKQRSEPMTTMAATWGRVFAVINRLTPRGLKPHQINAATLFPGEQFGPAHARIVACLDRETWADNRLTELIEQLTPEDVSTRLSIPQQGEFKIGFYKERARMEGGELLPVSDCAAFTGLQARAIRAAITDGRLAAQKIGRVWLVKKDDIRDFAASDRRPGPKSNPTKKDEA
jgi:hypothetical protein